MIYDPQGRKLVRVAGFLPAFEPIYEREHIEGGSVSAIGFEHCYESELDLESMTRKDRILRVRRK